MTRLASDIREASKPIYCSACFNSQNVRHIDFDAACDRGYGDEITTKVAMDDLILCENCVRDGARLIGMTDSDDLHARVKDLERKLDVSRKLQRQAQNYADTMEDALQKRPEQVHIDHRKMPRKQLEEVA